MDKLKKKGKTYDFLIKIFYDVKNKTEGKGLPMLEIVFTNGRIGPKAVKVIAVAENSKINSKALNKEESALVRKAVQQSGFCGKKDSFVEVFGAGGKIIVAGVGEKPDALSLQRLGGSLAKKLFKDAVACFYVEDIKGCKLSHEEIAHQVAFGMMIGSYRFDKYFTTKKQEDYPALEQVIFKVENCAVVNENFKNLAALGNAVRYGRDLCNEPANYLTPEVFAADIKRLEYLGLEVEILNKKDLEEKEFNMLLAVAQGSVNEPKVAVIKWKGNPEQKDYDLALVGKGVTFDAGGISIKPAGGMEDMKGDMTGAAVVVASLKALALQCAAVNVVGVVGLVENMPSGSATRPGDIVTSMSGQTVEIINTDAEGRLVLGDCLWYVQDKYGVKKIVDIATLTGATMRALGCEYAGIFSNSDKLAAALINAGLESGEKLWRLPVGEAYNKMINSEVADMKNIGGANAGGSTAACFLERFVKSGVEWAHLDIAGVDKETKGTPLIPKGATAFGVRLLNYFIRS